MAKSSPTFDSFFSQATNGSSPYPYQASFATGAQFPEILSVPTGVGKTATVMLGWLYRRRFHPDPSVRSSTPRRLVYCLPMRTLAEQTAEVAHAWLTNTLQADVASGGVAVHVLMGGSDAEDWNEHPDSDAILIGTQDMLLSRALNRGYAMSRYAWPIDFSLLNNDCLWVLDETQLLGVGLVTAAQLQGMRSSFKTFGATHTVWMSATLDRSVLSTVDHPEPDAGFCTLALGTEDRALESVRRLIEARKSCQKASISSGDPKGLARVIQKEHREGTLTLVVMNRVPRAQTIYQELKKLYKSNSPELFLLHSRYRPGNRAAQQQAALDEKTISGPGRIIVATQAIEAGVDVSATTLFTELALWSSLVQRFGRCNRRGVCGMDGRSEARVFWIDVDTSDTRKAVDAALPYEPAELDESRNALQSLDDVGPESLAKVTVTPRPLRVQTLRRKDLLDLWDTTPDLAGNDLDVSRYVRDSDDTDVRIYWRKWDLKQNGGAPPELSNAEARSLFPGPERNELCAVSLSAARKFLESLRDAGSKKRSLVGEAWRWSPVDRSWIRVSRYDVRPGMVLLLHVAAGGYVNELGWTGDVAGPTVEDVHPLRLTPLEADGDDSQGRHPMLLTEHLAAVAKAAERLRKRHGELDPGLWDAIIRACWWHDVGKAHEAFSTAMRDVHAVKDVERTQGPQLWAKSGGEGWPRYRVGVTAENDRGTLRPGFRHELASTLAWLNSNPEAPYSDLIAFLILAHHGKVRQSIRSLAKETRPPNSGTLFARGVWNDDPMPRVELGNGEVSPEFRIDLTLIQLGSESSSSWIDRVLQLREEYGPFRLAYLETLVRVADHCGSQGAVPCQ